MAEKKKATIILFSGDFDKACAAMIIGSGAAASGWDVTYFFTFWGINMMRDPKKKPLRPRATVEKMFAMMMPNGAEALKLSKMNMGGMGTSMMKKRMALKKVSTLREMIKDAKELGAKFLVCDMSMDVMGLQKEEFIDEVDEVVGVGTYLKHAGESQLNLFI